MICRNCGNVISDDSKFCTICGFAAGGDPRVYRGMDIPVSGGSKKRSGVPIVIILSLIIILGVAGIAAFFIAQYNIKKSPLHGAHIKKQVVWDTGDLKVTAKKLGYDKHGIEYTYYIEMEAANSGAADAVVTCDTAAINDIRVDNDLELKVPAGEKAEGRMTITDHHVGLLHAFSEFYNISMILKTDNAVSDVIRLDTGLKEQPVHINIGEDDPVYAGGDIIINCSSYYPSFSDYGPALEFYVENNSDKYIRLRSGDTKVGGIAIGNQPFDDGFLPHTRGYAHFLLDGSEMEKNDLIPPKNVESELTAYDPETGETLFTTPASIDNP